jgi:hypothetical protein
MKSIKFRESNVVIAKYQPEYLPLPAWYDKSSPRGEVISCWKLSFIERLRILFTGKLWFRVLTFHHPLQPQRPSVEYPFERKNEEG